jgi:hypothetical protein
MDRFPGAEIVRVGAPKDGPPDQPAAGADLPPAEDDGFGDNWVRDDGDD